MTTEVSVVLVTVPERESALRLVRLLVEEGLIACGNIVPAVTSIFRWEGKLCEESEHLLILKTERARIPDLLDRIPELHPYEVPEVLALDVRAGHRPYLEWIGAETQERRPEEL